MTVERMIELLEIEKECVLRNAIGKCNRYCAECDLLQDDTELHEMYTEAIALLKEQEAVDAAPVVHGRWIETTIPANTTGRGGVGQDKKKSWLCSNCRCAFDAKLLWCDNYCPNCGAKMDCERMESE